MKKKIEGTQLVRFIYNKQRSKGQRSRSNREEKNLYKQFREKGDWEQTKGKYSKNRQPNTQRTVSIARHTLPLHNKVKDIGFMGGQGSKFKVGYLS